MKEFAILHKLGCGQFLVDTDFDNATDQYLLSIKFWSENANAYVTLTLKWNENKEKDFTDTFEKFKSEAFCQTWIDKFNK